MDALLSVDVPECLREFWLSHYMMVALMWGVGEVHRSTEDEQDFFVVTERMGLASAMLDRFGELKVEAQAAGEEARMVCLSGLG